MNGRKIKVPGFIMKDGKLTKRPTYARKVAQAKRARKAIKIARKGAPLL
jgi:exopolysaccharide biosynthesis protein